MVEENYQESDLQQRLAKSVPGRWRHLRESRN